MFISDVEKTLARLLERTHRDDVTGCLISERAAVNHYGRQQLRFDDKLEYLPRVMWVIKKGPIPEGLFVLHSCDNPSCIEIDHLFLGTQKENIQDAVKKGRYVSNWKPQPGELHPMAKITEAVIPSIRSDSRPAWQIGLEYGISATQVRRIKNHQSWSHV